MLKVQRCFLYSSAPAELSMLLPGLHLSSYLQSLPPTPVLCSTPSLHCAGGKRQNPSEHKSPCQISTLVRPSGQQHPVLTPIPSQPGVHAHTTNTLRRFPCSLLLSWDSNLHSMMSPLLIILSVFPVCLGFLWAGRGLFYPSTGSNTADGYNQLSYLLENLYCGCAMNAHRSFFENYLVWHAVLGSRAPIVSSIARHGEFL